MKGLIVLFVCAFIFIWGFGMAISYIKEMHKDALSIKPNYGDFSPQKIESERKQAMDDYRQQMRDYKSQQDAYKAQQATYKSQQDAQKRMIEDQKRQLKDMQRMNKP